MYLTARSRPRSLSSLIVAAALASALGAFAPAVAATQMPAIDPDCVYYELPWEQGRPVVVSQSDPRCPVNVAASAAQAEAASWPDFDSTGLATIAAINDANLEAAAWPDFDPSDMTQEVAATEARQEAATWPDFDSTSIQADDGVDVAQSSPRMQQIAASQDDAPVVISPHAGVTAF